MNFLKTIMVAATAITLSGAANAATVSFTEGERDEVIGSIRVPTGSGNDTPGSAPGFDLSQGSALTGGDDVDLYGRIFGQTDFYNFASNAAFSLRWIFDGYVTAGVHPVGQSTLDSGFTATPLLGSSNSATFTLTNTVTNASVSASFTTNVLLGDPENLFGQRFDAGSYTLEIDGDGPKDALYDITISTVPLPAGGLLLLTALGGMGVARRRRRS